MPKTRSCVIASVLSFLGGLGVGYFVCKSKYDKEMEEASKTEREYYKQRLTLLEEEYKNGKYEEINKSKEIAEKNIKEKANIGELYNKISAKYSLNQDELDQIEETVDDSQYTKLSNVFDIFETSETNPYIITPEDYGDDLEYDNETLYLYNDGTLADAADNIIDDVDKLVGADNLQYMGRYEDDALHIRNPKLKTDYEIFKDARNFSEVIGLWD